jgi:predicted esterase
VAALDAVLSELMARYDVRRTALAGFSDGASYALTLGLANGDLVEHVLAFSPGYVGKLPAVGSPGVWVSHGTHDRVLPIEVCGRRIAGRLRDEGYEVRYVEYGGGHVLRPEDVAAAVDSWLTDRTTSSSRPSA